MFSGARLASDKQEVIRAQEYTPATKVFMQTRSNFWTSDGLSGFASTDLPLERLLAFDRVNGRSLLISYTMRKSASRLDAMTKLTIFRTWLRMLEKCFQSLPSS